MRMNRLILLGTCGMAVLVACSTNPPVIQDHPAIPKRPLNFPAAFYLGLLSIQGRLVGFAMDPSAPVSQEFSYAYENGTSLHPFNPGLDPACTRFTVYYVNDVLSDGRLALLKDCGGPALASVLSIFAYDWQTGQLEPLVRGPLPAGPLAGGFTWNPEMTRGVQQMGGFYQGTIYWIDPDGTAPMDIEIEDGGLKWNLKDYYEGKGGGGLADNPSWSPDGKTIAFFASNYGMRETPVPTNYLRLGLYFLDVSTLKPSQVISGILNAHGLGWSPDSRRLVFAGCLGWVPECGMWLYNVERKSLMLLDQGESFGGFVWIGNTKLVAVQNKELPFHPNHVWEYSLPPASLP